jgi:hypothetical protein
MSDPKEASVLDKYLAKLADAGETESLSGISALSTLALNDLTLHSRHSATTLQEVSSTLKGVGPDGSLRPMTMQTVLATESITGLHDVLMVSVQPQIEKLDTGLQELKQNSSSAWQALDRKILALEVKQNNFDRDIRTYVDVVKAELVTLIGRECREHCDRLHDRCTKLESYTQERDSTHADRIDALRRELGERIDRELNDRTRQLDRDRALYQLTDHLGNLVRHLTQGVTGGAAGGGAPGGGATGGGATGRGGTGGGGPAGRGQRPPSKS